MEAIELFPSHGFSLQGDWLPAAEAAPALIFAHGLGSTRQGEKAAALAAECARRGWAFAAVDFYGHGESSGTMRDLRGTRLLADLEAITQFVRERGHQVIFLVGSSMGGWAAAWWAALHPTQAQACALLAPALRFLEWQRLDAAAHEAWRATGRLRVANEWIDLELDYALHAEAETLPFARLCEQFVTPSLLVHGMADDTIPYTLSSEFIAQCAATDMQLVLLKDGDHRLNARKEWLAQIVCDFFQQRLGE